LGCHDMPLRCIFVLSLSTRSSSSLRGLGSVDTGFLLLVISFPITAGRRNPRCPRKVLGVAWYMFGCTTTYLIFTCPAPAVRAHESVQSLLSYIMQLNLFSCWAIGAFTFLVIRSRWDVMMWVSLRCIFVLSFSTGLSPSLRGLRSLDADFLPLVIYFPHHP